jgi:hypothetical protein
MNKSDIQVRIEELKLKANELKKEVEYFNALQLAR